MTAFRNAVALLLTAVLAACGSESTPTPTDCASLAATAVDALHCAAKADDLLEVSVGEVFPTQPSLGYHEVFYKLGRYSVGKDSVNKKFADWCEANGQENASAAQVGATLTNPATFTCTIAKGAETPASIALMKSGVIGPKGKVYLTDGHHTLTSFMELEGPSVKVRIRILGNLSNLEEAAFWTQMQTNKWTWLRDENDAVITPAQLPKSLGLANFGNDPFRGVLYFARDIGYAQNTTPFQEFYWGRWLRTHPTIKLSNYNLTDLTQYLALVRAVSEAQVALADTDVVSDGVTAAQLSKLAAWNAGALDTAGEFAKLSVAYASAKPGKIAYMLEYRKTLNLP
jgi:hypothetical protein